MDERWHQRSDGSRFWASGILTALCDGKELRGYAKILRDFTEKKLSDERFAETNRLLMLSSEIGRAFTEKSLTGDVLLQCAHAIVRNMGAAFARI